MLPGKNRQSGIYSSITDIGNNVFIIRQECARFRRGQKNNFGPGAMLIALYQHKVRITGQGAQNFRGRQVLGREIGHLEEAGGSQDHCLGAGLPETPGIFARRINFYSFMAVLDGRDLKAALGGQADEFTDQFGFAAIGKACRSRWP